MTQVVYDAEGKAGILCGENADGQELVIWLGTPEVVGAEVDEKGNGTAAYSTVPPAAPPTE